MSKNTTFNRTEILKKLILLFHHKGYCATSMQNIVAVSGLNRSSIYNTFGNKLTLFTESFNTCETIYKRHIQQVILNETNPLKALRKILEISLNESIEGYAIPNYISEAKNDEKLIQQLIIAQKDYFFDLFLDIIKRGQNLGIINNSKSTHQYATYLLSSYFGLQSLKRFSQQNLKLENTIYDILTVLE